MEFTDYYATMNIPKTASQPEIKKAFRKLAVQYHPDKNAGNKVAEEKFKRISEANEVLSNPEKRKKYDELGENWKQHEQNGQQFRNQRTQQQANQQSNQNGGSAGNESYFSDFFEQFFSSNTQHNRGQEFSGRNNAGSDYETEMNITLEEAYEGTNRIIQLEHEKVRITTKPGSFNDQKLRIKGKGANGHGPSNRGDLYVHVKVAANKQFDRKGSDLYTTSIIDLSTAVLGGEAIIPTLMGQLKITITAGTQSGKTIRLKGKGMPVYEHPGEFGNLYVLLNVQIPVDLTAHQKSLFDQFKQSI